MPFPVAPKRIPAEELKNFLDSDVNVRTLLLEAMANETRLALANAIVRSGLDLNNAGALLDILQVVSQESRASFVQALNLADQRLLVKEIRDRQNSESNASVELTLFPDEATEDIEGDS